MITVKGTSKTTGKEVRITWVKGRLYGDKGLKQQVENLAASYEKVKLTVGAPGQVAVKVNHLEHQPIFVELVSELLTDIKVEGIEHIEEEDVVSGVEIIY